MIENLIINDVEDMNAFVSSVVDAVRRSYEFKMIKRQFNDDKEHYDIQLIGFPIDLRQLVVYTIKTTEDVEHKTSLQIASIVIFKIITRQYPISVIGKDFGTYIYNLFYYLSTEDKQLSSREYEQIQGLLESSIYNGDMETLLSFIDEVHWVIGNDIDQSSSYMTFLKYKNILENKSGKDSIVEIGKNIKK